MKKHIFIFVGLFCIAGILKANTTYSFQHYSVGDGLSQNTVMAITQDHKGFMWFGTWDGLNKFDGYQFTIYKSYPGDNSQITANRIDFIKEDQLGYIWFQTYDDRFHRFDPRLEKFVSLPGKAVHIVSKGQYEDYFLETNPGEIWMVNEQNGIIKAEPKGTKDLTITEYNTHSKFPLKSDRVNFIKKDKENNVWAGTDIGIHCIKANNEIRFYQPDPVKPENNFSAAYIGNDEIWFGTDNGMLWRYSDADSRFERIALQTESRITDLEMIDKRYLIATTTNAGFYVYDIRKSELTNFSSANESSITSDHFSLVAADSYGIAWLISEQLGIFRFNPKTNSLKHFRPKVDAVHSASLMPNHILFEDVNRRLWINPQGGGFSYYNREEDRLEYFFNEPESANCRFSNVIHTAYSDNKGHLWLSTYNKGLEKIVAIKSQFQLTKPETERNTLTSNEVRALKETSDKFLIVATKDGRTRFYDRAMQPIGFLCQNGTVSHKGDYLTDLVYCIYEDPKGRLWMGSKGRGLIVLTPQHNPGEKPRFTLQQYNHSDNDAYSLSNDNIYSIIQGPGNDILIGTFGGGLNVAREKDGKIQFIHAGNDLKFYPMNKCSKIRNMLIDRENTLWIASTNGLLQVNLNATRITESDIFYSQKIGSRSNSLGNNDVHCLHIDKSGTLWIGTFGGGLNKLIRKADAKKPAEFQSYTMTNGLGSDIVLCIQEDKQGNLWLSSENTISRYDLSNGVFQNFNVLSEAGDAYFSESTGIYHSAGKLLFGSNKGIYAFDPELVLRIDDIPAIEFTGFQLFNKNVEIGGKNSPLTQCIGETQTLTLHHEQSVFSLEYAAIDYESPEKIQYAFMLENFEDSWNYVHDQRKATYTNLPKGTYRFRVKSTNKEGIWMQNEKVMTIIVKPSFWETPIAYILYAILILTVLFFVYYLASIYNKLRSDIEIEQKVTDIKLRFFTNISHELRTPLSLIMGPVENILHNEKITPSVREQLQVIQSNTSRMLRMINQILDFRKIQNKKMRLKIQPTHIENLVRETAANFTKEALDRNIHFEITNKAGDCILYIDRDKTDIILYNLLSNAFKFTPQGKSITVEIEKMNGFVLLKVMDEGIGIAREKRNVLFERFASSHDQQSLNNTRGSGIGLNLVKELVDLHKGYIEVDSELNKGTTFTVMFREGKEHYDDNVDFIVADTDKKENQVQTPAAAHTSNHIPAIGHDATSILIVEDNEEMRAFLSGIFRNKYRTETAKDGAQGLEKARKLVPDLIISDLMMPNKDGLEMTNDLKSDEATNHIPIILLTAKTAVESRLDALKYGADDYITKPFSPLYLKARVENILTQRKRLQERYRKELLNLTPQKKEQISPEETFLAKLLDFMERNMDNNELMIDDMVSEMALGRTVFFNKLKSLTGLSPVEFVREVRVKRAAQLLETGQYNVTEITYMVGMNDSRYFSKCFKAMYGMTPTEYKKSLSNYEKNSTFAK